MPSDLSVLDRLRIERAVWSLDQRLYDLPRRSRIGHRRELRDNLTIAAREVGAPAALADMGSPAHLASDYLDAELGPRPRPSWMAAALFLLTTTLVLTSVFTDAANAYGDGLLAGDGTASGRFHWGGISHLQAGVTYTVSGRHYSQVGGAFTPLMWALLLLGAVAVGRLWRLALRHRRPA